MADTAIIVFTRLPVIGAVKTRLFGILTPQQACRLQEACLADAVAMANQLPRCRRWLCVAGPSAAARALGRKLGLVNRGRPVRVRSEHWRIEIQHGRDLGARMRNAFAACFRAGCSKAILIGTDTPWMGRGRLELALRALDRAEVVLGPARDGGYYLLGARRPVPEGLPREIFTGIDWGTSRVLQRTVARLRRARVPFRLLARDFDLDRPADLARAEKLLRRNPGRAPALSLWIKDWRDAIPQAPTS